VVTGGEFFQFSRGDQDLSSDAANPDFFPLLQMIQGAQRNTQELGRLGS